MSIKSLERIASRGNAIASYYLSKIYYDEHNDVDNAVYWLLKSLYLGCNSGIRLLNQLEYKYPSKVKKIRAKIESAATG